MSRCQRTYRALPLLMQTPRRLSVHVGKHGVKVNEKERLKTHDNCQPRDKKHVDTHRQGQAEGTPGEAEQLPRACPEPEPTCRRRLLWKKSSLSSISVTCEPLSLILTHGVIIHR